MATPTIKTYKSKGKPRPINPSDSATLFPERLTYPNGTYASTSAIGSTGAFGATLPRQTYDSVFPLNPDFSVNPPPDVHLPPTYGQTSSPTSVPTNYTGSGFVVNPNPAGIGENYAGSGAYNGTPYTQTQQAQTQAAQPQNFTTVLTTSEIRNVVNSGGTVERPPAGTVFTGDPNDPNTALWINYWNAQAVQPTEVNIPHVQTKDEIWNMKANQRRRRAAEKAADNAKEPKYQPFFTQSVTFRV